MKTFLVLVVVSIAFSVAVSLAVVLGPRLARRDRPEGEEVLT